MAITTAATPPPPSDTSSSAGEPTPTGTTTTTMTASVSHFQAMISSSAGTGAATAIDIDAWTVNALQALSVSPVARGTGTPLAIPLDGVEIVTRQQGARIAVHPDPRRTTPIARPPSARDSQRKREMLQKGKEGSRQRRRWENDRLVGVPNAQPPLPADWEARPTHPITHVPYHMAQYWDRGVREHLTERAAALQKARKTQQMQQGSATGLGRGEVPRDLRESAKRRPAVRGWVRSLEEPVRKYLLELLSESGVATGEDPDWQSGADSEDEEIVFVGRNAGRQKGEWKRAHREVVGDEKREVDRGLVFDALGDDESAAFRRWLTHSISDYYGLESRSVTVGSPARRVVYVGVKPMAKKAAKPVWANLPRPLWEVC